MGQLLTGILTKLFTQIINMRLRSELPAGTSHVTLLGVDHVMSMQLLKGSSHDQLFGDAKEASFRSTGGIARLCFQFVIEILLI